MPRIYGGPAYEMGDTEIATRAIANAPITSAQAQKSKLELGKMRRSLELWLSFRAKNDAIAAGRQLPRPLFRRPGLVPPTPAVMKLRLSAERAAAEQELATQLHQLLSEVFDASSLPESDVKRNPQAAVQLAKIAIAGKLPGESVRADATGAFWIWPLVVVIGIVAFTIMTSIRSSADVAKEKERIECIKAGACTDTGFFLKIAAVGAIAWFVWTKLGVGERVKGVIVKQ